MDGYGQWGNGGWRLVSKQKELDGCLTAKFWCWRLFDTFLLHSHTQRSIRNHTRLGKQEVCTAFDAISSRFLSGFYCKMRFCLAKKNAMRWVLLMIGCSGEKSDASTLFD
jgi:hypothetical protein